MLTVDMPTSDMWASTLLSFLSLIPHTSDFKQAFETKYVARFPDILLTTMDLYTPRKDMESYKRSFSIVQSSGMGKSRLVDHSATSRFTFPFNLHETMPIGLKSMRPPTQFST
jgi:hypothetical protein